MLYRCWSPISLRETVWTASDRLRNRSPWVSRLEELGRGERWRRRNESRYVCYKTPRGAGSEVCTHLLLPPIYNKWTGKLQISENSSLFSTIYLFLFLHTLYTTHFKVHAALYMHVIFYHDHMREIRMGWLYLGFVTVSGERSFSKT